LEAHGVRSPAGLEDVDRFLHARPPILERLPQKIELLFEPPRAHAEDHSAAGEEVQGGHRLGHDQRRPQRKDQDGGAEPDPAGHRAHPGQRGERIEVWDGRRPGGLPVGPVRVRAGRLFGDGEVIGDPERRVPDRFRQRRDRHQGVGRGQRPRGGQRDPVLHARGVGVGEGNVLPGRAPRGPGELGAASRMAQTDHAAVLDTIRRAYGVAVRDLRACYNPDGIVAGRLHFNAYWARDGFWAVFGALALGDHGQARAELETFTEYQFPSGKFPVRVEFVGHHFTGYNTLRSRPKVVGRAGGIFADPIDPTALYLIAAREYLQRTGDMSFCERFDPVMDRAIRWLGRHDHDGDGLIESYWLADWMDSIIK